MDTGQTRLVDGSRVAVIGGGPAGSFFALHALRFARQNGLRLQVTVFEEKSFADAGRSGCNMCAGIISSSLVRNLSILGVDLPKAVVLSRISAYCLHTPYGLIETPQPDPQASILSVYRGGGPRGALMGPAVSFDGFLLRKAAERGAEVVHERVEALTLGSRPRLRAGNEEYEFDLAVLACGVNSGLLGAVPSPYGPPPTQRMAQDELWLGAEAVAAALGNKVHVFLLPNTNLVFGTLIPKGEYINVSLLSRGPGSMTVGEFLRAPAVREVLPSSYRRSCGCAPLISLGPARHPYGERFVAVGDAAVSRLYKDGIGAAFHTARQAALTAVQHSVGENGFRRHYMPTFRQLHADNRYGRALFAIQARAGQSRRLFNIQATILSGEQTQPYARRCLDQVIWGMFTGAYTYRSIVRRSLCLPMWKGFLGAVAHLNRPPTLPGTVGDAAPREKKVLILGGGFAGVYTALHLQRTLRRHPEVSVYLVSDENFFLFTPLLHEVATGGIETRHIALPLRRLSSRHRFSFVQADVQSVDLETRSVHTSRGMLPYDFLVLALGSVTDRRGLPALESRVLTLKTLRDGIILRNHVIRMFETASSTAEDPFPLLTFAVVGGGTTGVQLAAELQYFTQRDLLKEYSQIRPETVRVVLIQEEKNILPEMDTKISVVAQRELERQGVEVLTSTKIVRVRPNCLELSQGRLIPTHTVVWVPGITANPVVAALPVEKDRIGRAVVDNFLQVPGHPGVYALGDNAHMKDERTGEPLPPTAHIAVRQPKVLADNILAELEGRPKRPYRYLHMGQMVTLGPRSAVADIFGFKAHGFLTRLVWLIAYSSVMMGRYNKVRVFTDWALGLFHGRDSTLLRVRW